MVGVLNKFGAQKQGVFDSKAERFVAQKYGVLEEAGLIRGLRRCDVHFLIIPEISHIEVVEKQLKTKVKRIERKVIDEREARYTPDFFYYDCETDEYVMLEVKSFITKRQQDYPLRRKLMKHIINEHNARGRGQWRFEEVEV
jgi:ribosome-binding factor A